MTDKRILLNSNNELVAEDPDTGDRIPVTFEMLELPEASEGDTAESTRAIAIDPNTGDLLVGK